MPRRTHKPKGKARFDVSVFQYDEGKDRFTCPHGKLLKLTARKGKKRDNLYRSYEPYKRDCAGCPLREPCLLTAKRKTRTINVALDSPDPTLRQRMKERIDTPEARAIYDIRSVGHLQLAPSAKTLRNATHPPTPPQAA